MQNSLFNWSIDLGLNLQPGPHFTSPALHFTGLSLDRLCFQSRLCEFTRKPGEFLDNNNAPICFLVHLMREVQEIDG